MKNITNIFENINNLYANETISTTTILSVLFVVLIVSLYQFLIYRYISRRAFYNKSFNIAITVLPFFIATIILCLQSNIVITLGTIGALAIIRFRTAVKDPVDMIYLLWSVHNGIVCGCQLYELAILTSLVVTIVLVFFENIKIGKKPFVLVINCKKNEETYINTILKKYTKAYKIKSRNFTSNGVDYAIELSIKNIDSFLEELSKSKQVNKFSLIEYDADDIV